MFNLYKEAKAIAQEAFEESGGDIELAREFVFATCDGHELAIYYGKAIEFCASQNTGDGEDWLEGCGGLITEGDTFGSIACRIAFATLLVASETALREIEDQRED